MKSILIYKGVGDHHARITTIFFYLPKIRSHEDIKWPFQSNLYDNHMKLAHPYLRVYKYARHLCDLHVAQRQACIFMHVHILMCQFHMVDINLIDWGRSSLFLTEDFVLRAVVAKNRAGQKMTITNCQVL
jgi:hypothetical protein